MWKKLETVFSTAVAITITIINVVKAPRYYFTRHLFVLRIYVYFSFTDMRKWNDATTTMVRSIFFFVSTYSHLEVTYLRAGLYYIIACDNDDKQKKRKARRVRKIFSGRARRYPRVLSVRRSRRFQCRSPALFSIPAENRRLNVDLFKFKLNFYYYTRTAVASTTFSYLLASCDPFESSTWRTGDFGCLPGRGPICFNVI